MKSEGLQMFLWGIERALAKGAVTYSDQTLFLFSVVFQQKIC